MGLINGKSASLREGVYILSVVTWKSVSKVIREAAISLSRD